VLYLVSNLSEIVKFKLSVLCDLINTCNCKVTESCWS
jgi:hypothetical protein